MARIILTRTSVKQNVTTRLSTEDYDCRQEALDTLARIVEGVCGNCNLYVLVRSTDSGYLVDTGDDSVIFATFVADF